jgi:hypothetical protein
MRHWAGPIPTEEDAMDAKRSDEDVRQSLMPLPSVAVWTTIDPCGVSRGVLYGFRGGRDSGLWKSDRALKEGLAPADPRQVLAQVVALPMATWSYKGETVRHLGPMAQDFSAAFGLGADDRHIHVLDASGVALAALQGLHAVVQAQAVRLAVLERELDGWRATLSEPGLEAGERVGVGGGRR